MSPLPSPRWALVTGAASGIVRATATMLMNQGWSVAGTDLSPEALDSALSLRLALDVRSPDAWARTVEALRLASDGQLHLLVNNAGLGAGGWLEDVPEDRCRARTTQALQTATRATDSPRPRAQ